MARTATILTGRRWENSWQPDLLSRQVWFSALPEDRGAGRVAKAHRGGEIIAPGYEHLTDMDMDGARPR